MIDPKELKKLADACRKAGIKHFKNDQLEFTLTEDAPVSEYKRKKSASTSGSSITQDIIKHADAITEEELLFWSAGDELENMNS